MVHVFCTTFASILCGFSWWTWSSSPASLPPSLLLQAFAKAFDSTPDDLDMHIIYDVSHNIAKFEEHVSSYQFLNLSSIVINYLMASQKPIIFQLCWWSVQYTTHHHQFSALTDPSLSMVSREHCWYIARGQHELFPLTILLFLSTISSRDSQFLSEGQWVPVGVWGS